MALNQGTYRNNSIPEYNTEHHRKSFWLRDAPFVQRIYLWCIPDLLTLGAYSVCHSVSITWWVSGLELPSSKLHIEWDVLRMCFSEDGLWPTHFPYHVNWEYTPATVSQVHLRSSEEWNHWKCSSWAPAAVLPSSASSLAVTFSLTPYRFTILGPLAAFLWGSWSLTLLAYRWDE